jgi:hypothetical protein
MSDRALEPYAGTGSSLEQAPARKTESTVLDDVLKSEVSASPLVGKVEGVVIGFIAGIESTGVPLVDFPANPDGVYLPARTVVAVAEGEIGREVVLMFEDGNVRKPVVLGFVQPARARGTESQENGAAHDVRIDGERLLLTAEKDIVLRCGEASITLTRAGKVVIRGTYLLSRSAGVNKIHGGSIQLN